MNDETPLMAVLDRIVDGTRAVLLVGPGEMERVVLLSQLPPKVAEGTRLRVVFAGDELVSAIADEDATARSRQRIASKLELLRRRGRRPRSES